MAIEDKIKIMLASDQVLYIDALKSLLNEDKQIEISGQSILHNKINLTIQKHMPDVLLLDANSMDKSIWDFIRQIIVNNIRLKIIILANNRDLQYIEIAKKMGIRGFVLKSSPKELLIAAIKIVNEGKYFYDPGNSPTPEYTYLDSWQNTYQLSTREIEIIKLIKDGHSSREISSNLQISHFTVETHRKNIYNKLHINKVTELIRFANEHVI